MQSSSSAWVDTARLDLVGLPFPRGEISAVDLTASTAYEFLGESDLAIESYREAGLWQECLFVATQANLSAESMDNLSLTLAENLLEGKDYQNAATVCLDYRNDVEEAARALCKGSYFGEAMRVVRSINFRSIPLDHAN